MLAAAIETQAEQAPAQEGGLTSSAVLHRDLRHWPLPVVEGQGNHVVLEDGRRIFDASGGASVSCLGYSNLRVREAVQRQMNKIAYCPSVFYTTEMCEQLCRFLVNSTDGHMARAYIVNSGSEAMEAAMKLARQFFLEKANPEPLRSHFIARKQSYHGITLGSLALGGHAYRREKFEPLLIEGTSRVSPCYAYRHKPVDESDEKYVSRLQDELDAEFQRVGPETVCAFVMEPVVGAALGCVPSVLGYLKAMKDVCRKYGALFILDEVMCGMGRTGVLHAWQLEGVAPDIQTIGKGLGGGYMPVAGTLASHEVMEALGRGSGTFVHGHTYQAFPPSCAAALEVQTIIRDQGLLANVRDMGDLLSRKLWASIGNHPNVGDIRGRGLFWGIEFVADKQKAIPFPVKDHVAAELAELGLTPKYGLSVYPGSGTADGIDGDHIILSPAYTVTTDDVTFIAETVTQLVTDYFSDKAKLLPALKL